MKIQNLYDDAQVQEILRKEIFENPPEDISQFQMDGIADTVISEQYMEHVQ